ncbi:hypothetical protein Ancab_025651 [Ancistrocladus abbreviatus]
MAGSYIESAVNWLGKQLVEEAKYLRRVKKKAEQLREELLWMQCFLRHADACQHGDAMVLMWVGQMRDYTYDAEDIIAKYLLEVDIHRECQTRAVLEEAVCELTSKSCESIAKVTDKELREELRLLQHEKKCLIVLDDVWSFKACTSLKAAFLVGEQSSQSSQLFMTCDQEVASHAAYEAFIHEPRILDDDESWKLLQTNLGGAPTTIYGNDHGTTLNFSCYICLSDIALCYQRNQL